MPTGSDISHEMRQTIVHCLVVCNKSADETYLLTAQSGISLSYLNWLRTELRNAIFRDNYLAGPHPKLGRPRKLDCVQRAIIRDMVTEKPKILVRELRKNYVDFYYAPNNIQGAPSMRLVTKTLHREGFSRKKPEHTHGDCDELGKLDFVRRIRCYDTWDLVDIDEMSQAPDDFLCPYARGVIGKPLVTRQIVIWTRSFCVIAAVTPLGFLCWDIIEGTVSQVEFCHFLSTTLRPLLTDSSMIIIDNARTHHTPGSRVVLEQVTAGRYHFSPPYSPHLKPIETSFKLVKEYIHQHELEALMNPAAFIHAAFTVFSIGGDLGSSNKGNWNKYFRSREFYLQNMF
jgi:transposase